MGAQQGFDLLAQPPTLAACFAQHRRPFLRRVHLDGLEKDRSLIEDAVGHICWSLRNSRQRGCRTPIMR
jgi:hypothetical protein